MRVFEFIYVFGFPIVFIVVVVVMRSRYKNKSNAGAFFFENNSLVLNSAIPYPISFDDIECVELHYSSWELEHKLSYGLAIKVIKKTGKGYSLCYD